MAPRPRRALTLRSKRAATPDRAVEAAMRRARTPIPPEPWLGDLERRAQAGRSSLGSHAAHRIRVDVARLRVWLALGGGRAHDDDLRWLRDKAGVVRDLEVQLDQRPPEAWASHLRSKRVRARRRLRRALGSERVANTIQALRVAPSLSRDVARRGLPQLAARVLERGDAVRRRERDMAALHALRSALRRVRYALEWLGEEPTKITALQELIGDACDRHVALEGLKDHRCGRPERRYRHRLERERAELFDRAFTAWKILRPDVEHLGRVPVPPRNA